MVTQQEIAAGRRFPIVAIEGLDGCGKSTAVRLLADRLGAVVIRNPPQQLAAERIIADALGPVARRAWYLQANWLAMAEAMAMTDRAVVLDRSIASTLCFGAAERGEVADLTDVPPGFPLPDLIVLLALPESVRRSRHAGRRGDVTVEEERLSADAGFRDKVLCGYRNFCSASVDASVSPEGVVSTIMTLIDAWSGR